ncbi:MAG: hypothetical protein PSV16_12765 [Flavobacterium sp.]|nr:hypothetical protein [Flavobacterium sp.]
MAPRNLRACIYPKDVERILGKTYRQSRLYLNRIKSSLGKESHQFVFIEEFCKYSGLPVEDVMRCIIG